MKKISISIFLSLVLGVLFLPLEGVSYDDHSSEETSASSEELDDDEYDILARDEIDDTDTLAIPFDDSEEEDEEEVNLLEKKDVFRSPHSR